MSGGPAQVTIHRINPISEAPSLPAPLEIIPVLDVLGGQVVRGLGGEREAYQPIRSMLCQSSDPATVAQRLCDHSASRRLYVADLDGIMRGAVQHEVLRAVLAVLPDTELWLDAGFADVAAVERLLARLAADEARRVTPVFGSESMASLETLAEVRNGDGPLRGRGILSLDRRGDEVLDPAGCWSAPHLWPETVIVMTLERVGADRGPALDALSAVRSRRAVGRVIGAGGIRHAEDLTHAAAAGADAWLVASALHDGRLAAVRSP